MKAFSALELMTLAVSLPVIGAVSSCLDSEDSNYKCVFIGSGFSGNQLNLDSCGITDTDVDDGLLQDCFDNFGRSDIDSLFMSENELTTLPDGVFDGLEDLTTLGLFDNGLTELPNGVFNGLESLFFLNLQGNQLQCLPTIPTTVTQLFVDVSIDGVSCESRDIEADCSAYDGFYSSQGVCCAASCGSCRWGPSGGCHERTGGSSGCCPYKIRNEASLCSTTNLAPCKLQH